VHYTVPPRVLRLYLATVSTPCATWPRPHGASHASACVAELTKALVAPPASPSPIKANAGHRLYLLFLLCHRGRTRSAGKVHRYGCTSISLAHSSTSTLRVVCTRLRNLYRAKSPVPLSLAVAGPPWSCRAKLRCHFLLRPPPLWHAPRGALLCSLPLPLSSAPLLWPLPPPSAALRPCSPAVVLHARG
jgi:hypothetical protein